MRCRVLRPTDYTSDELKFAYAYHAYLHWQTYRNRPCIALQTLHRDTVDDFASRYSIHVLECQASSRGLRLLVSLRPDAAVAAADGKLKGQTAKWLREQSNGRFARGYFACTTGKSTAAQVDAYLSAQAEHHGYSKRARPPVYVKTFALAADDERRLQPPNARAVLQFHFVLASRFRRGVFSDRSGPEVTKAWRALEQKHKFALLKVSFVPDHVHLAVRAHPSVAPAEIAVALMNSAQGVMWRDFQADVIRARLEQLWQPAVYIGSFGDLATPQIEAYLRACREP